MSGLDLIAPALLIALAYSLARAISDLRARRYVWAAAGTLSALAAGTALLVVPIPSHAIKIDLPR